VSSAVYHGVCVCIAVRDSGSDTLLALLQPLIVAVCSNPSRYADSNLHSAATLALTKFMVVRCACNYDIPSNSSLELNFVTSCGSNRNIAFSWVCSWFTWLRMKLLCLAWNDEILCEHDSWQPLEAYIKVYHWSKVEVAWVFFCLCVTTVVS